MEYNTNNRNNAKTLWHQRFSFATFLLWRLQKEK